jgi:hypothetical protein
MSREGGKDTFEVTRETETRGQGGVCGAPEAVSDMHHHQQSIRMINVSRLRVGSANSGLPFNYVPLAKLDLSYLDLL